MDHGEKCVMLEPNNKMKNYTVNTVERGGDGGKWGA